MSKWVCFSPKLFISKWNSSEISFFSVSSITHLEQLDEEYVNKWKNLTFVRWWRSYTLKLTPVTRSHIVLSRGSDKVASDYGASAFSSYMIQTVGPYKQTGLAKIGPIHPPPSFSCQQAIVRPYRLNNVRENCRCPIEFSIQLYAQGSEQNMHANIN